MSQGKILFQLSGSIACFKACQVLSRLVQEGFDVEVVATAAALRFVGQATLEGLAGKPIHHDLFEPGRAMDHIGLARWADLVLLCPASASALNRLASGSGDDLLSALFLARDPKKNTWILPAMNSQMWLHPATVRSVQTLRAWGVHVLEPSEGQLACGEIGAGRLLEPDVILSRIRCHFGQTSPQRTEGLKVLLTAGGTAEPIDRVRSITNVSTGRTGATIAETFARAGHDVTALCAENSLQPEGPHIRLASFRTFKDLEQLLAHELKENSYDVIIHAAAVSDFSLSSPVSGKIESSGELVLHFKSNPKLIDSVRAMSQNPDIKVVAFKMTAEADTSARLEAVRKLVAHAKPDFVVHNDISEISATQHFAKIFAVHSSGDMQNVAEVSSRDELAFQLERLLAKAERKVK